MAVKNELLIRQELWSQELKYILMDELNTYPYKLFRPENMVTVIPEATVSLPPVSLPVALAMGTAAVLIKNPVVSRRFWSKP